MVPADTTPEARRAQIAVFRAMEPAARVEMALEMSEEARRITLAGIAHRQPELTPEERIEILHRVLGNEQVVGRRR